MSFFSFFFFFCKIREQRVEQILLRQGKVGNTRKGGGRETG
jgi:hypothetical protein